MSKKQAAMEVKNQELPDVPHIVPYATMIYQDPASRTMREGLAILNKPYLRRCDDEWWSGHVEFMSEPGAIYMRSVWRKKSC